MISSVHYRLAEDLKNNGFPQHMTRRHINVYETVFWTRRHTDYPVYPTNDEMKREIIGEFGRCWPEIHPGTLTVLVFSGRSKDEEFYAKEYVRLRNHV